MSEQSELVGSPQIKVCRICNQDEGLLLNIFGSDSGDTLYNQEIEKCLSIKVSRSDPCSLKVCHQCVFGLSLSCQLVETYQKTRDEFKACRATTCYLCAKSDGILSNLNSCEEPGSQSMLFKVEDCIGTKILQEGSATFKLCHHCHLLVDTMFNLRQKAAQVNMTLWNGLNVSVPQEDNTTNSYELMDKQPNEQLPKLGSESEESKVETIEDVKPTDEELSGEPEPERVSTADIDSAPESPAGEMDYSDGVDDYDDIINAVDPLAMDSNLQSVNDDSVIVPKREKFNCESNSAVSRARKLTIKKEESVEEGSDSDNDSSVAIKAETDEIVHSKDNLNSENSQRKCKVELINLVNDPNFSDLLQQNSESGVVFKTEPLENTKDYESELLRNNLQLNELEITENNVKSPNKVLRKSRSGGYCSTTPSKLIDTDRNIDNSHRLLDETELPSNRKGRGGINNNEVTQSPGKGLNVFEDNEDRVNVDSIHTESYKTVKANRGRPKKCIYKIESVLKEKQSMETPLITIKPEAGRNINLRRTSLDKTVSKEKQNVSGSVRKHMEKEGGNKTDDCIKTTNQQNSMHNSYHTNKKVKPGPRRFQRNRNSSKTEHPVPSKSMIEADIHSRSNSDGKNIKNALNNTEQLDDFPHKNTSNLPVPNSVTEKDFNDCKKSDVQHKPKRNTRNINVTGNVSTYKSAVTIINSKVIVKSRNLAGKEPSCSGNLDCGNLPVGSINNSKDKIGADPKTYSDNFERDLLLRNKHSDKKVQCLNNWVVDLTLDNTLHWNTPVVVPPPTTVNNTKPNAANSTALQNQVKRRKKPRKIDIFERVLMEAGEIVIEQPWEMDELKNSTDIKGLEVPLLKEHPMRTKLTRSLRTSASDSTKDVILETGHENNAKKEVSGKRLLDTSLTVTHEVPIMKERTRRSNVTCALRTSKSGERSSKHTSPETGGHQSNSKKEVHGKGLLNTSSTGTQEVPILKERTRRAKLTSELRHHTKDLSSRERPGDTLLGNQQQRKLHKEGCGKDKQVGKRRIESSDDDAAQNLENNQIKKRRIAKEKIPSDLSEQSDDDTAQNCENNRIKKRKTAKDKKPGDIRKHSVVVQGPELTTNVLVRKRKRSIIDDNSGEETTDNLEADNIEYVCAVCTLIFESQVSGKIHELTHFKRPRMQLVRCKIDQIGRNESGNHDLKVNSEIGCEIDMGSEAPLHSEFDDDIELQNEPCSIQGSIDCLVKKLEDDYDQNESAAMTLNSGVLNDRGDIGTNYEGEKNESIKETIVDKEEKETTDTETIELNDRTERPNNDSVETNSFGDELNEGEIPSQKDPTFDINYCEVNASTEIKKRNAFLDAFNKGVELATAEVNLINNDSITEGNRSETEDSPNKEWQKVNEILGNSNNNVERQSRNEEMVPFCESNMKSLEKYVDVNDGCKATGGLNESREYDKCTDDHLIENSVIKNHFGESAKSDTALNCSEINKEVGLITGEACKLNEDNNKTINAEDHKAMSIKKIDKVIENEGSASQRDQINECQLNELDKSPVTDEPQQEKPCQVNVNQPTTVLNMPSIEAEQLIGEKVIQSEKLINNSEHIVKQSMDNETEKANDSLKEVEQSNDKIELLDKEVVKPTNKEQARHDYRTLKDDSDDSFKGKTVLVEDIGVVNREVTSNKELLDTYSRTPDEITQPVNNTGIKLHEVESNKNEKHSNEVVEEVALLKKSINVSQKGEENKTNNDLYEREQDASTLSVSGKICTSDKLSEPSDITSVTLIDGSNNKTVTESDVELIRLVQLEKEDFSKNKFDNLKDDNALTTVDINVSSRIVLAKSAGETELTKSPNTDSPNESISVIREETQKNSDKNVLSNENDLAYDEITRINKLGGRGVPSIGLDSDQANCDSLMSHSEELLMVSVEQQKSTVARAIVIQNESDSIVEVEKTMSDSEKKDTIEDLSDISDENSNDRVFFNHLEENGSNCFEEGAVSQSSNAATEGRLSRGNPSTASEVTDDTKELFADDEDSNLEPKTIKVLPA